ncbi:MAG: nucleotidyl transferase AbiEii/AbiGii toxin family protein, partial [Clostridia bacterium]|nr:nucleotidyl transferase AbiEii/AbiGii toxin family protein [Clostridia bacterium]
KTCLSAQDDVNIKSCLQEILDQDIYKKDFEYITIPLIFEAVSYDEVKSNLQKVIDSGLLE